MDRGSKAALDGWRASGFIVSLGVFLCQQCHLTQVLATDGACLENGRQRVCVRGDGPHPWPEVRCARCESRDLYLMEEVG